MPRASGGSSPSCWPPGRGHPLIATLDRNLVGCQRAPNTLRARQNLNAGPAPLAGPRPEAHRPAMLGLGRSSSHGEMAVWAMLRHPTAFVPIAMSFGALAMVAWYLASYGTGPQPDEVVQVRLWQLLVVGQLPIVAYVALRYLPRAPRPTLVVLALQLGAAVLAVAPVALLDGL
jgi:hypothetical protein